MTRMIAIRSDASRSIGSGHVRRMAILAEYLKHLDISSILLCRPETKSFLDTLASKFDDCYTLRNETEGPDILKHKFGSGVNALIFDHYHICHAEHSCYRSVVPNLIAIDDMANRYLDVDILFDGNLGRTSQDYMDLTPAHCKRYVGPEYQIIKSDFYALRHSVLQKRLISDGVIKRIFISLGGTDPKGITWRILANVITVFPEVYVDVVVGSLSPNLAVLRDTIRSLGANISLHVDSTEVAKIMSCADFAIGAGGTMTWERNCLGLPSILLVIADNQDQVGSEMTIANAAIVLDAKHTYPEKQVISALIQTKNNKAMVKKLGENAADLSNKNGPQYISSIISRNLR